MKRGGRTGRVDRLRAEGAAAAPFIAFVFAALTVTPASAQCAMCRTLLQTPEGQHMAAAFRSGILLLLAAPFSIFGLIATLAIRSHRRREAGSSPPGETV